MVSRTRPLSSTASHRRLIRRCATSAPLGRACLDDSAAPTSHPSARSRRLPPPRRRCYSPGARHLLPSSRFICFASPLVAKISDKHAVPDHPTDKAHHRYCTSDRPGNSLPTNRSEHDNSAQDTQIYPTPSPNVRSSLTFHLPSTTGTYTIADYYTQIFHAEGEEQVEGKDAR